MALYFNDEWRSVTFLGTFVKFLTILELFSPEASQSIVATSPMAPEFKKIDATLNCHLYGDFEMRERDGLLGGVPGGFLGTLRRSLRGDLPSPLAFALGALGALLLGEDAEVFQSGLLGHEFSVVLEEHLGGVACLQGNLSSRLGDGQAVGAERVTEPIVDKFDQRLPLGIDQLGGGILEELGEVELVADIGEDRTGFLEAGFEPCLQGGDDRSQSAGSRLGLILAYLDDPLVEPDVFPLQAEDFDGPESRESPKGNEGDKPLLDILQQGAELIRGIDPDVPSLVIIAGRKLRLGLLPSGEVLLVPRIGEEGQEGHAVVVLGASARLLHAGEPVIDVVGPDTSDLAFEGSRGLLELRLEIEDVATRFSAFDRLQELGREFRESNRGEGASAIFLFEVLCVELRGGNDGATPKQFVRLRKLSDGLGDGYFQRGEDIHRIVDGGGFLRREGGHMGYARGQGLDDFPGSRLGRLKGLVFDQPALSFGVVCGYEFAITGIVNRNAGCLLLDDLHRPTLFRLCCIPGSFHAPIVTFLLPLGQIASSSL